MHHLTYLVLFADTIASLSLMCFANSFATSPDSSDLD